MKKKREKFQVDRELGRHFGKFDLDRIGFFDDRPNGPYGKYVTVDPLVRSDFKGKQLLAGPSNDFIDKVFKRIFDGEALQTHRPANKRVKAGVSGRVMLPPSPTKLHSTPNDWFGCIGKPPKYFSPEVKKLKDTQGKKGKNAGGEPPNCKIKPNPLGGPGYVDICINPYPKHSSEPYDLEDKYTKGGKLGGPPTKIKFLTASAPLDYFPPNPYVELTRGPTYVRPRDDEKVKSSKSYQSAPFYVPFPKQPGGQHAGCFSKFPEYTSDTDQDHKTKKRAAISGLKFISGGTNSRTKYTESIINKITGISCNIKNYREYRERVYPLTS